MKRIAVFLILSAPILVMTACGGGEKIKGIAEREINRPKLPSRIKINRQAYNYYVNGTIYEAMGEYYMAADQYREALKIIPQSDVLKYSYASALLRVNDYRGGLNTALKIKERNTDVWLLIGDGYRAVGIIDSALYAYNEALEIDSNIIGPYYIMAAHYQKENNIDSLIWASKHIARLSTSYKSYQQLANIQLKAGYIDEAREQYLKSLALDSSDLNIRSFIALSAIYEEEGDMVKARDYAEKAAAKKPDDLFVLRRLLQLFEDDNDYQEGIKTSRAILALDSTDINIKRRLAILYYEADSLHKADSMFSTLIDEGDNHLVNHYYSGQIAMIEKDFGKAIKRFSFLTENADTILDGWMNLGKVYHSLDSIERAAEVYEEGLTHLNNIDDSLVAMFSLAASLERLGKFDSAVELFELLLEYQPDNGQTLNYLGYMLADKGLRLDYAEDLIKKALKIQPDNGAYIDSYGWVLFKKGKYKKALKELLRAEQLVESDPVIFDHIGDAYSVLEDDEKAVEYWNKALELDPDNETIREKIGR